MQECHCHSIEGNELIIVFDIVVIDTVFHNLEIENKKEKRPWVKK